MGFKFRWLGQAGFLFELGDRRIAIDPFLSYEDQFMRLKPIPITPEELDVNTIIITHDHCDHLNPTTLRNTDHSSILYAAPVDCHAHLLELGIPADNIVRFSAGDELTFGDGSITAVPAYHTTPEAIGIVIRYEGVTIYVTGDTLYNPKLTEVGDYGVDIMFVCINGRLGNMNAAEAAKLAYELPCRVAIPDHYGMFAENTADPEDFVRELNALSGDTEVSRFICDYNVDYDIDAILREASAQ